MPSRRVLPFLIFAAAAPAAAAPAAPVLFAPGVISGPANDGSPTFSPDGNELFFARSSGSWSVILTSHRVNGAWSKPAVAPFSGEWSDSSPGMAPDGSFLVFTSMRPRDAKAPKGPREANVYRVTRTGDHWSAPEKLPPEVNIGASIWKPSVAGDGTIYFVSIDKAGHRRLYVAAKTATGYAPAQPLPFSDGTTADVDPEIAPDGSFLVFCSAGRAAKDDQKDHLFFVRRTATGWADVQALRYPGDDVGGRSFDQEPHLGPDHRTIYFASDRGVAPAFPRTHAQAVADEQRLEAWDNSNSNVWTIPAPAS
jgi:Tol biopolymer transport system component